MLMSSAIFLHRGEVIVYWNFFIQTPSLLILLNELVILLNESLILINQLVILQIQIYLVILVNE